MITKVKSVKPTGKEAYQSKNGLLYSFYYEFEDGAKICANHKTEVSPFKVGDVAKYEVTKMGSPSSLGKVSKPKPEELTSQPTIQPNKDFGTEPTQLDRIEAKIDLIISEANLNNSSQF